MRAKSIVNPIMSSVTYVLSEEWNDKVWLVDCGDVDKIVNEIGDRGLKGVLLTHAHYDHIYGLRHILNLYPDCIIYTNEAGREGLASAKLNLSKYHDDPIEIEGDKVKVVKEGESIELFANQIAKVLETPGHNPSCLCFEVGNYLFTGDAYIPDIPIVTNLPGGNKPMAQVSKERILSMMPRHEVMPGHIVES